MLVSMEHHELEIPGVVVLVRRETSKEKGVLIGTLLPILPLGTPMHQEADVASGVTEVLVVVAGFLAVIPV